MPELSASVRIEAPAGEVFSYVDDWRNTTRFLRGLERWEPLEPDRSRGVGARFRAGLRVGPKVMDGEMEVVEHVPDERVVFVTTKGPAVRGRWTFVPDGSATVVTLHAGYELPGGVFGRLLGKTVSGQGRRELAASLSELKRQVESRR